MKKTLILFTVLFFTLFNCFAISYNICISPENSVMIRSYNNGILNSDNDIFPAYKAGASFSFLNININQEFELYLPLQISYIFKSSEINNVFLNNSLDFAAGLGASYYFKNNLGAGIELKEHFNYFAKLNSVEMFHEIRASLKYKFNQSVRIKIPVSFIFNGTMTAFEAGFGLDFLLRVK